MKFVGYDRVAFWYLTAVAGVSSQITGKQMTSPSSRDFRQISAFLFNQFDPNFVFDNDNFEDEFKQFLLQLGYEHTYRDTAVGLLMCVRARRYPFNISKSSLKSPGSPHTWPSLLAALVWMIELLQVHTSKATGTGGADMAWCCSTRK